MSTSTFMAEVRPFPGIRFNKEKISDISQVICPPYDVISPAEQQAYHERSGYNIIRLEFGLDLPGDAAGNNKYTRARETWRRWLSEAILQEDSAPGFYLHKHRFTYKDKIRERTGLVAAVKLEPWDKKIVLPHENTGTKPKEDRLNLMRACQANISPILSLYQDPTQEIHKILAEVQGRPPLLEARQNNGETHWLWKIEDAGRLDAVQKYFANQRIFIADGHHRYETALAYQKELGERGAVVAGAGYVMMTLVELADPGLLILPVHRLVRGLSEDRLGQLKAKLQSLFDVKTLPVAGATPVHKATVINDALRRRRNIGIAIGAWGLEKGALLILRLRQNTNYDALMPPGHSYYYYRLEVSRLQHLVMDELEKENGQLEVAYTPDEEEVLTRVSSGEYQLGFLIKALEVKDIKSIALAGDKVPKKSSYFHPKLPTGLVMRSITNGS